MLIQRLLFSLSGALCAIALLVSGCAAAPKNTPLSNPWSTQDSPTFDLPESIGFYSAGCLKGGVTLSPDGEGYQVMRLGRRKYYGHPELVSFLEGLGKKVARSKRIKTRELLIGDLGQPRGGPTLTGHASHQSGLDVDIWFETPTLAFKRKLTLGERDTLSAPSMLASHLPFPGVISKTRWTRDQLEYLRLAAQDERVERIFVNPVIKKELCVVMAPLADQKRAWLSKLRPWWGHEEHFHVRLKCPASNILCKTQEPIAAGDGCDADLAWWFSEEARLKALEIEKPTERKMPELPEACMTLVETKT